MNYILGWTGAAITIANYFALTNFKGYKRRTYYTVNILPYFLITISSAMLESWIPIINNTFAISFSLYFLITQKNLKVHISRKLFDFGLFAIVIIASISFLHNITTAAHLFAFSGAYILSLGYLLYCGNVLHNLEYFLYNTYASGILIPALYIDGNWPLITLNIIWCFLSLTGYIKEHIAYKKKKVKFM